MDFISAPDNLLRHPFEARSVNCSLFQIKGESRNPASAIDGIMRNTHGLEPCRYTAMKIIGGLYATDRIPPHLVNLIPVIRTQIGPSSMDGSGIVLPIEQLISLIGCKVKLLGLRALCITRNGQDVSSMSYLVSSRGQEYPSSRDGYLLSIDAVSKNM
jgi:hypothetical protein